jgi:tryptophan synthase
MGVTGATGVLSTGLPELLERVHRESGNIPTAVGFGISTRDHFLSIGKIAEGAVIGSQIVNVLSDTPAGQRAVAVEEYCYRLTGRRGPLSQEVGINKAINKAKEPTDGAIVDEIVREGESIAGPDLANKLEALSMNGEIERDVCDEALLYMLRLH